jgi:hypothetical protein
MDEDDGAARGTRRRVVCASVEGCRLGTGEPGIGEAGHGGGVRFVGSGGHKAGVRSLLLSASDELRKLQLAECFTVLSQALEVTGRSFQRASLVQTFRPFRQNLPHSGCVFRRTMRITRVDVCWCQRVPVWETGQGTQRWYPALRFKVFERSRSKLTCYKTR